MKKWYKESYFNRRNWLLENFEKLDLNSNEVLLLLVIDFSIENNKKITYEYLNKKLALKNREIDALISDLVSRNYLKISTNRDGLVFDIDSIFEFDTEKYEIVENLDLYDTLTESFNRPLTVNELQRVNEIVDEYSEDKLIKALRIAEANRKVSIAYIDGILKNDKSL